MNNKKILFSDFDGTLVGQDIVISDRLKQAVLAWEEKGHLFSIATGRIFAGHVQRIADELRLTSPQVSMGGAQIVDPINKHVLHEDVIPDEDVVRLIEVLEKRDLYFWLEKDFVLYNQTGEPRHASNAVVPHKKLSELTITRIPKVGIKPDTDEQIHFLRHDLAELFPSMHIIRAGSAFGLVFDVTAASASKHSGVLKVLDMTNIDRENSIGVGDGYNDFPLLSVAGYKVAMGNAVEELKDIADHITGRYDEDGVAQLIEKLLKEDN